MNKTELRIRTIEEDLTHVHRERMTVRQSDQYDELRNERAKASPDPRRIEALKAAMMQTERDKSDESITVREVLEPLREQLALQQAPAKKKTVEPRR